MKFNRNNKFCEKPRIFFKFHWFCYTFFKNSCGLSIKQLLCWMPTLSILWHPTVRALVLCWLSSVIISIISSPVLARCMVKQREARDGPPYLWEYLPTLHRKGCFWFVQCLVIDPESIFLDARTKASREKCLSENCREVLLASACRNHLSSLYRERDGSRKAERRRSKFNFSQ